jgi:hypothetical protein
VELDFSTINVRYDTELGFFGVLGVVPSVEDCEDVEQGWYYDDADEPRSILLCPQTCDAYEAGSMNNIQAVFGCDAIGAKRVGVAR